MRASLIPTALCLTLLATVANPAFAGVRGKPTKSVVEPVPVAEDSTRTETIVPEPVVANSPANGACYVPVVIMAMPVMSPPPCATCGGMGGGLRPAAMAAYSQAFPGGYYRTGAEAGMYHFPYYSYRRPWYFPGQPSFHRSTDLVW